MRTFFLHGPLGRAPLRARLAGQAGAEPATLDGHGLKAVKNTPFPLACAQSGAALTGVVLRDVTPDAAARLRFALEAAGANCAARDVETGAGERVRALTALMPEENGESGPDLAPEAWEALAGAALDEILGYFGQRTAAQVAQARVMILARAAAQVAAATSVAAEYRATTGHEAVEVQQVQTPHQGFFLTRSYRLRHPRFDGSMTPPLTREVFIASDASIVLPYDPVRDRVLLVEQFRMGPFGRGDARPWMLEPVAGRIDAGETPESTAHRECLEEAGLTLHRLEKVSAHYCSPGDSTEYFHIFIGLCDLPELSRGRGGLDSEHEDIRTHVLSYEQAMGLLDSGEADAGPLVVALLWLAKSRDRLRATA